MRNAKRKFISRVSLRCLLTTIIFIQLIIVCVVFVYVNSSHFGDRSAVIGRVFRSSNNALAETSVSASIIQADLTYGYTKDPGAVSKAFTRGCSLETARLEIATHMEATNIFYLSALCEVWDGPIMAVVVLRSADDLSFLYSFFGALPNVTAEKLLCQTTFHFLGAGSESLHNLSSFAVPVKVSTEFCDRLSGRRLNFDSPFIYSANKYRNIALHSATADYILMLDADVLPSANLHLNFAKFLSTHPRREHEALILPAFELHPEAFLQNTSIGCPLTLPTTKSDLLRLVRAGSARPFYHALNPRCQQPTNYPKWYRMLRYDSPGELRIAYSVDFLDPFEPFVIVERRTSPAYDERFEQYGVNRLSQICELHMAGYDFFVLDEAFVTHLGFKIPSGFHARKDDELRRNQRLYRDFKEELLARYANLTDRRC